MDPITVIRHRLRAQRLTGEPLPGPVEAVRWSGAVQAQEHAEAKWSLVMRADDADDAAVQTALDAGELLRTHALRPTWHFVAADDLRWIQRLTGPRVHAANRYAYRVNGLGPDVLARTDEVIVRTLADGEPRIRTELRAALAAAGIETPGQRLAHAVMHAELEALICSGPRRGRQHTYVLARGRVPEAPDRSGDGDLVELTRRYVASHGPVGPRDLAWWASLTLGEARRAFGLCGEALVEVAPGLYARDDAERPPSAPAGIHLIPMYDELGVGVRDLKMVHAADPVPAGQLERPVLLDGRVVGTWRRALAARTVTVTVRRFVALDGGDLRRLRDAVDRFAASLGLAGTLELLA